MSELRKRKPLGSRGELDGLIARIVDPADRERRSRKRNEALSAELTIARRPADTKRVHRARVTDASRSIPASAKSAAEAPRA
jgi:hypothetical protein